MKNIEWHVPVKIYNYCNTLSELMLASDMILTKAGGLITSESLAAGLPMLLCDVLPGQEEGNAKIVEDNEIGRINFATGETREDNSKEIRHARAFKT